MSMLEIGQTPCVMLQIGQPKMHSSPAAGSSADTKHTEGQSSPAVGVYSRDAGGTAAEQDQYRQQAAGLLKQLQHLTPQARAALHAVQQPVRSHAPFSLCVIPASVHALA